MMDVLTKEQRHKNMQHIRSKNTKPEVLLRKALWRKPYHNQIFGFHAALIHFR